MLSIGHSDVSLFEILSSFLKFCVDISILSQFWIIRSYSLTVLLLSSSFPITKETVAKQLRPWISEAARSDDSSNFQIINQFNVMSNYYSGKWFCIIHGYPILSGILPFCV
jgi:hypothetical protein